MTDYIATLSAAFMLLSVSAALAQGAGGLDRIVPEGAEVERVATGFTFTEGPAWDGKGHLYFSDIPENVIKRVDESGNVGVFVEPSEKSNGLMFDAEGYLIACRHRGRDVVRISPEGEVEVLAASYKGKRLNSPNDCIIAADGAIYFTDPHYGLEGRPREQEVEGVYRIAPDGSLTRVIDDMTRPNGLFISPDGKTLYVADSQEKKLRAYTLLPDGSATAGRDFAVFETEERGSPDGMTLDAEGNIYCTDGGGVWVFDRTGKHLGTIKTPEVPANCTFGGADRKTLYITARTSVYRIRLLIPGLR